MKSWHNFGLDENEYLSQDYITKQKSFEISLNNR